MPAGTNSVTLKYEGGGSPKDAQAVRALTWYFYSYQSTNNGVGTNATLELALKNDLRDLIVLPRVKEAAISDSIADVDKTKTTIADWSMAHRNQLKAILDNYILPQ